MNELQATAIMIFFFVLRCMLPLAFTLLIGRLMNKLVSRWQAEEKAIPVPAMAASCWEIKNCPPAQRSACPAYDQREIPCWQMKSQLTGSLPEPCLTCALYTRFIGQASHHPPLQLT